MRNPRIFLVTLLLTACSSACSTDGGGSTLIDRGTCDALIECASDLAPASRDEYVDTYGEGGTCWAGGPNQWQFCRDACRDSLDALNLIGQATGQTCGTCQTDADCNSLVPGATCDAGVCVGGGSGESEGEGESEGGDTDEPGCMQTPDECLTFVECIGALLPEQQAAVEAMYGAAGSCWCGTEAEANACYQECVSQLAAAQQNYPTEPACHDASCSLDELMPGEPYGPVVNGACPDWNGSPQLPLVNPLGLAGSVCAPGCVGVAQSCPDHVQTDAEGTCYLTVSEQNYCVSRCWVDPELLGGHQCQCGATCQPHGGPDGEGNLRGICTFE